MRACYAGLLIMSLIVLFAACGTIERAIAKKDTRRIMKNLEKNKMISFIYSVSAQGIRQHYAIQYNSDSLCFFGNFYVSFRKKAVSLTYIPDTTNVAYLKNSTEQKRHDDRIFNAGKFIMTYLRRNSIHWVLQNETPNTTTFGTDKGRVYIIRDTTKAVDRKLFEAMVKISGNVYLAAY